MNDLSNKTSGVPQESVLGPLLWNVIYNGDLAPLIGFKDDPKEVEEYANETISSTKAWLEMVPLDLVEQNTEAILITNSRKRNTISIRIG